MATSIRLLGLMLMLVLVSACSGSTMRGSWSSPDHIGKIENVYLVGITQNELVRRIFEDSFDSHLTNYGVAAVSSYKDLPANEELNREEIVKAMTDNGCDSVLFTNVVSQRSEIFTNPGYVVGYASGPYYGGRRGAYDRRPSIDRRPDGYSRYNNWSSYYNRRYDVVYQPPTSTEFTILTVESVLYDMQTGEMIWLAQLETIDEINIENMVRDYVEVVTKDLKEKGLL